MTRKARFLKTSSLAVKIAAWTFLLLGLLGGIPLVLGRVPDRPRLLGAIILAMYGFLFFFLYFVSTIADMVVDLDTRAQDGEKTAA
jgi:hypothetical protein